MLNKFIQTYLIHIEDDTKRSLLKYHINLLCNMIENHNSWSIG